MKNYMLLNLFININQLKILISNSEQINSPRISKREISLSPYLSDNLAPRRPILEGTLFFFTFYSFSLNLN